ncbi:MULTISPECIES: alpha/beta hydrolase [Thiorhodovibrio]|uniref:alpha/beta hydrolase n=1 Tax=Thiorhodovibrio TaxID=61593 RepID=UPI0019146DE5|nr:MULTISPECIES: alpha/beta fold hydrolase [Thiorhodovibrio]MBK5967274.1 alpha/beta hydrolase [Thiorhodovibrio winogradskyi]WPL14472.1 acetoin dehydrogenase E2 subunit dihydrolipoyllysine-residue acetyltransferase [Thiorhodovibrio litoralis]
MTTLPLTLTSIAAALALGWLLFHFSIHFGFRAKRLREQGDPGDYGLPFETIAIPGPGRRPLFGWWVPAPGSHSSVILLHGWGSNAEQMLPLAVPLHASGRNVLLFDSRNHGRSPNASFSSLPRFAEDLDAAIDWLQSTHPAAARSISLSGHSVGAGAVLLSASRRQDLTAVVSISAFAHPRWLTERHLRQVLIPAFGIRLVARYVEWLIGHRFDAIAPMHTIAAIRCPVLLVHGEADTAVPISDAHAIAQAGSRAAAMKLITIPGGDHASSEHIAEYSPRLLAFLAEAEKRVPSTRETSARAEAIATASVGTASAAARA